MNQLQRVWVLQEGDDKDPVAVFQGTLAQAQLLTQEYLRDSMPGIDVEPGELDLDWDQPYPGIQQFTSNLGSDPLCLTEVALAEQD